MECVYILKENTKSCPHEDILGAFTTNKLAEEAVKEQIKKHFADDPELYKDDIVEYQYRDEKNNPCCKSLSSPYEKSTGLVPNNELYAVYFLVQKDFPTDIDPTQEPKKYFNILADKCYSSIDVIKVPLDVLNNFY